MGRWSSDAFLRYWRMSEYIAPLYAKNIPTLQYRPSIKHSSPSLGVSSSHRGMRRLAGSSRLLG
ncbi:hypothetical protein AGABI1DRAFT_85793 [Agaricus bisporus var. burnettii JB137-S8]|uniref:Uncharacterized protein n=1 Tax=Agaricus bisporus var. burnettii (strain JB137-S8 / ATCC MYA-4627 / FGSC 10392) TaxID=597362 RepID=K5X7H3_AGABU|nr:uncharacterized protein AGABI1DRAFT_85793 [Agaricus bisporus var. burnettii JB137-S8]EKM78932.1 hypothetical protein AGABI1DRAFT_85793 [Agaricus bisporus var. burnettii JB137-S8]